MDRRREEMINEAGNEFHAIIASGVQFQKMVLHFLRRKDCLSNWGAEKKPIGCGCTNCSSGINYKDKV